MPGALFGAAAALTALGIAVPLVWWLVFPGLALFLWTISSRSERLPSVLLYALLFGFLTGGAGTVWFWDTLPLTFLGIENSTVQTASVGMTWVYVALSLALPVPIGAALLYYCRSDRFFPFIAGLVWAGVEFFRMWSFALTTWGPKSLFGPHFSAAAVGYSLAENQHLLQLADPFGVDGLNFFVGFVAGLVAWRFRSGVEKDGWIMPGAQLGLVAALFSFYPGERAIEGGKAESETLRFAVIYGNLDSVRDHSTHATIVEELTTASAAVPPVDVVALPEEFGLTSVFWKEEEYRDFIERHLGERDVLIINSRNNLFPEEERNQVPESKKLIYDSTRRGEVGRYIKQMLMPLGEYTPAFTKTFFSVVRDPQLHAYLDDVGVVDTEYTQSLSVGVFRGVRIGGLLCSDLFSPYLYRALVRDHGAEVLVNLSNHFWFHGSRTLDWKTTQMARVHAVRNRRPMLVANNVAPALVIDSRGEIKAESRWGARGVLYATVPVRRGEARAKN